MSADENQVRDHAFDGIEEYDNRLPLWWQAILHLSVVFAVVYVAYYHFGPGLLGPERYEAQRTALAEEFARNAKDFPEEEAFRQLLSSESRISDGRTLFLGNGKCVSCHTEDGTGQTGPNLRDDRWVQRSGDDYSHTYGNSLTAIANTIRNGRNSRGMAPMGGASLTLDEMISLTVFVAHWNRTAKANGRGKSVDDEVEMPIDY